MAISPLLPTEPGSLLRWGAASVLLYHVLKTFYEFFTTRMMFRRLQSEGIPMLPHSFLFGHLAVIAKLTKGYPSGFNPQYIPLLICENWESLFPGEMSCPELIYLDMWPLGPPIIWTVGPSYPPQSLYDLERVTHHPNQHAFMRPMTRNLDLFSSEGAEWRTWRSRFNPGFSSKNVTSLTPLLLEEIAVFRDVLRSKAGPDGEWGSVFQLEPLATNLTFDIIVRASIDMRLNEQTRDPSNPSSLKRAMVEQISLLIFERNIFTLPQLLSPIRQWKLWRNNRIMRSCLMPTIRARLDPPPDTKPGKTIVDLALKTFLSETHQTDAKNIQPDALFIDTVLGQLKLFIFAGHDTTAGVLSWVLHSLHTYPHSASLVRAELDSVLGPDAAAALTTTPHLLNALPYTSAFVKEAFRLNPSGASIRISASDFTFTSPSGKQFPTQGFMIFDALMAGMRSPAAFPRADEFLPERWLAQPGEELYARAKNAWRGFSMGPRGCIGQELAMAELKLAVVMVAREVEMDLWLAYATWAQRPTPGHAIKPSSLFTAHFAKF
ncbi:cytochrome p450 [Podospora aff. communis PSN243]|uniref:Cytochrome p450 n=1 Tax=Podospora aff. communis PSN243 TaxID=3040156 RepID=A0AAV9GBP7_9PEZI|nr:cytochrome p450 [Podospora aff. communis PSN243]